ncbi:nuclear transport factor 2 family protein [Streptomyces scabiei]|uniref:nuclear transport factor 2 family protein n=1 Tax=Streptomyces scabiei TaxID=1930 RepID=UPI0039F5BCA0
MTDTTVRPPTAAASALHAEVEHFCARQMQLLDRHACEERVNTFTADGVFDAHGPPAPAKGREAIAAGARGHLATGRRGPGAPSLARDADGRRAATAPSPHVRTRW